MQSRRTRFTTGSGCAAMAAGSDPWVAPMARDTCAVADVPGADGEVMAIKGSLGDGVPMVDHPADSNRGGDNIGNGPKCPPPQRRGSRS